MSDRLITLLASPTFQGLAGFVIGFSCLGLALVKGFDLNTRVVLGAMGVSALNFGATKLGIVKTEKRVETLAHGQRITQEMISQNTTLTVDAAAAAATAAQKADVAATHAATAAEEAAQSRRMP